MAEDGDIMFVQNVGIYLRVYTVSQPRRPTSSLTGGSTSVSLHFSSTELFNIFGLKLVLSVYTGTCWVNLILVSIDKDIQIHV
jgi:hypothetical protein